MDPEREKLFNEATAQRARYGLKEWTPHAPISDALGDAIVFLDARGERYTVRRVEPNFSHIRVLLGGMTWIGPSTEFEARAPNEIEAALLASLWINDQHLQETRLVGSISAVDSFVLRYRHGGPPLD